MNFQRGVSLTELLIVIAIIGILAGLSVPGYAAFRDKYTMRQEVASISGLINQAKLNAMRNHNPWRVVFAPATKEYYAEGDNNGDGVFEDRRGPFPLGKSITFASVAPKGPNDNAIPADGVSFNGDTIAFNSLGSCNAGYVYLQSEKQNAAIRVMAASGLVSTWYYQGESWVQK